MPKHKIQGKWKQTIRQHRQLPKRGVVDYAAALRQYNRYELTTIRLDEGRFLRPQTDPERVGGKIFWSDFVMLTECVASSSTVVKYID